MTMIMPRKSKCILCGTEFGHDFLASTNAFGSMDLDMRPPGMKRYTMNHWVEECPSCGFVSGNIEEKPKIGVEKAKEIVESEEYKNCDGFNFKNDLSKQFYRQYMINKNDKNRHIPFQCLLHCAWSCDDYETNEITKGIRLKAIEYLEEDMKMTKKESDKETKQLLVADLYRRTDQFEKVIKFLKDIEFSEMLMTQIANYQITLAKEKDDKCHRVIEATGDDLFS